jgi:hypothetical protein
MFYQEILVSADQTKGIAFSTVLLTIAHYNLIDERKYLVLDEYLRRRAKLQRVEQQINLENVKGLFRTRYWRLKFREFKEGKAAAKMTNVPQFAVPEIYVDNEDEGEHPQRVLRESMISPSSDSPIATPDESDGESTALSPGTNYPGSGQMWSNVSRDVAATDEDIGGSREAPVELPRTSRSLGRRHRPHRSGSTATQQSPSRSPGTSQPVSRSPSRSPQLGGRQNPFSSPSDLRVPIPTSPHYRGFDSGYVPDLPGAGLGPSSLIPVTPTSREASLDLPRGLGPGSPSPAGHEGSVDQRLHSRQGSAVSQNVLDVLEQSEWGQSMRRSFTHRRPGDRRDQDDIGPPL